MTLDQRKELLISKGDLFRRSIEFALQESGLELASLARQGCICCDVGNGPEIPALIAFNPSPFIVSEPLDSHFGREKIDRNLSRLIELTGCELIREEPLSVLENLAANEVKVGLITWLRVFPEKADYDSILSFLRLAKPLLYPGGAVIISVQAMGVDDEDIEGGYRFITAGNDAREFGYKTIDFPDTLESERRSAGDVFIVASA